MHYKGDNENPLIIYLEWLLNLEGSIKLTLVFSEMEVCYLEFCFELLIYVDIRNAWVFKPDQLGSTKSFCLF